MTDPISDTELLKLLDDAAEYERDVPGHANELDIRWLAARRLESLLAEVGRAKQALWHLSAIMACDSDAEAEETAKQLEISDPSGFIEAWRNANAVLAGTQVERLPKPSSADRLLTLAVVTLSCAREKLGHYLDRHGEIASGYRAPQLLEAIDDARNEIVAFQSKPSSAVTEEELARVIEQASNDMLDEVIRDVNFPACQFISRAVISHLLSAHVGATVSESESVDPSHALEVKDDGI